MILVIGGACSGKRAYVKGLGYGEEDIADAVLDGRPVLDRLHALVARDPAGAMALLGPLCAKAAVICDEVGSGVIPADPAERLMREQTGRLCCRLAQRAERVVRLVAGIPVTIKG